MMFDDRINETFDVPCVEDHANKVEEQAELEDKAFAFLKEKATEFGAVIKKKMNPHDFGPYPSFELYIDTPYDAEGDEDVEKLDEIWDKINNLHDEYVTAFEDFF